MVELNRRQRKLAERYWRKQLTKNLKPTKPQSGNWMKPITAPAFSKRVVVCPDEFTTAEQELSILAAMETLKKQQDGLRLEFATSRPDIHALCTGKWFLAKTHLVGSQEEFEALLGDDVGLLVSEPDIEQSFKEEQRLAQKAYNQKARAYQRELEYIKENNLKDVRPEPLPDFEFYPRWHQSQGYLWDIAANLGLSINIPPDAYAPVGEVPLKLRRLLNRDILTHPLFSKPFVIYDFENEPNPDRLVDSLQVVMPSIGLISVKELRELDFWKNSSLTGFDGWNLAYLLVILTSANCLGAVGPVGTLVKTADAALRSAYDMGVKTKNLPFIVQLYTGNNFIWDGAQSPYVTSVERSRFTSDQLPDVLREAVLVALDEDN